MEENIEHKITVTAIRANGDVVDQCFCGAYWVHSKDKSSVEERQSIFESHVKYFNKVQHTVL